MEIGRTRDGYIERGVTNTNKFSFFLLLSSVVFNIFPSPIAQHPPPRLFLLRKHHPSSSYIFFTDMGLSVRVLFCNEGPSLLIETSWTTTVRFCCSRYEWTFYFYFPPFCGKNKTLKKVDITRQMQEREKEPTQVLSDFIV